MVTQTLLWGLGCLAGLPDLGLLAHPLLMAPLGASAVLIYAVPTSALAQPWSVVVGNTLAAILALMTLQLGLPPMATMGLAVFASLTAMAWARCLHPPGGAVALATVLAAPLGLQAALIWLALTVFASSALLVGFGVAFHHVFGRPYPVLPALLPPPKSGGTLSAKEIPHPDRPTMLPPKSQAQATYAALHADCAAFGTRLFTVTVMDDPGQLTHRAYTSHPVEYPVSGTKPITRDGWYDQCITARQTFVANTTPEFARYFFDHALITSLGLGSCINVPIFAPEGQVLGTVNLLAEEHHFTPHKLAAYAALITRNSAALFQAMSRA